MALLTWPLVLLAVGVALAVATVEMFPTVASRTTTVTTMAMATVAVTLVATERCLLLHPLVVERPVFTEY